MVFFIESREKYPVFLAVIQENSYFCSWIRIYVALSSLCIYVQAVEYKPFDTNAYEIKKQTGNGRFGYAYIINYIDQLTKQEKRSCPYLNILMELLALVLFT